MKRITKFNKVWAYILALTLLVGVLGPMQIVRAEVSYVDSGNISLHSNSTSGNANVQTIYFNPTNCADVDINADLVADTGTIKFKSASTGAETTLPSGHYWFHTIGADVKGLFSLFMIDTYKASNGDTVTIEGTFTLGDTATGVNFEKVVFEYVNTGTTMKWRIWPSNYTASGAVSLHANSSNPSYCGGDNLWFTTTDTTFPTTTLFATTGSVILNRGGDETDISETYALRRSGGNGPYYLTFGHGVLQSGDMVTISGKFSSADGKSGIDFETVTFQYTGDGTANDTDDYWEVVKQIDYIDSGALSLHSNSSSPRDTSGTYDGNAILWFNTVDVTFPKNNGSRAVTKGGQITVKKAGTDEVVDIYATGAAIMSQKEGLYGLWLMDANKVSNGDMLTIQGKFAMSDGSAGINFQPVTFKYIEESGTGYWIAEGMTFTSGQYLKTNDKSYASEILAFEADIRLSANAINKGGVILGTDDGSSDAYTFGVDSNGAPYLSLKDGSNAAEEYKFTDVNVCTNEWVNLVIKRDKTNGKVSCVVDGVSKGELSTANNAEILPTADAVVGGNDSKDNAQFFKGRICTVKLYSDTSMTSLIAHYDMSYIGANAKTVSDSSENAYDLSYSLRWTDKAPTIGDYAYSFAVVGDTQTLNDSYTTEMSKVYKYITDNAASKTTKFVFGLGDITEWNSTAEWERAKEYITTLDKASIPYSLCRGNHEGVLQGTDSTLMNTYFPYDNYKDKLSVYYDGKIENSCQFLTVGKVDYLIFALDYNPSEDVVDWAASIIETHPHHNVIITTHSYISVNKQYTADGNGNGAMIWEKLAKKYENVVLVLSGHVGYTYDIIWNQVKGDNENLVTQMMVNPQWADADVSGGTGMVAMLYFSADGKNVQVEYYSTIRNQWLADTNQFSFELNVVEHKDAVTVEPYTNVQTNYRSTAVYTYPTLDGYLFAGWFTDEVCTKALAKDAVVDDTTTYYAKFVDENVLTVKRQLREGTTTDLRLVTSVDSLLYEGVGFKVAFNNGELKTLDPFKTVYASLFASDMKYRPEVISAASKYFAVLTIKGLPETLISENVNVEVQPYWITLDGTTVVGKSVVKQLIPTE